jgi:hypothetical protein
MPRPLPATRCAAPRSEGVDHETALHGGLQDDAPAQATVLMVSCVRTELP